MFPFQKISGDLSQSNQAPTTPFPAASSSSNTVDTATNTPSSQPAPTGSGNYLGSEVKIKGSVVFQNEFSIDGQLEGEITSQGGTLAVLSNAVITGDIVAGSVVVEGRVEGNITVSNGVTLTSTAVVIGDITSGLFSVESGASILGSVKAKVAGTQPSSAVEEVVAAPEEEVEPSYEETEEI